MITPTDKYSTRRMWSVVQHQCVANSRNLAISAAVIFGLIFLMSLLMSKIMRDDFQARGISLTFFYIFIAGLITNILGSLTFNSYSTKPKRISGMMLPAKKSEKFIAMNIIYIVFGNLLLLASFFISDISTAAMFNLQPLPVSNGTISIFGLNNSEALLIWFGGIGYFLFMQAIYVLGSAIWPKMSFLKTFVALSVVQTILTILLPFAMIGDWVNGLAEIVRNLALDEEDAIRIAWTLVGFLYVFIAGVYYIAWIRFRNLAVAKRFLS